MHAIGARRKYSSMLSRFGSLAFDEIKRYPRRDLQSRSYSCGLVVAFSVSLFIPVDGAQYSPHHLIECFVARLHGA